jgi:hypothetical protein
MISKSRLKPLMIFFTLLLIACGKTAVNEAEERAEILKLHNLQKKYHFDKMTKEFVDQMSDNLILVNKGLISTSSKDENTARFNSYFNSVTFEKWDDISPPIIRFSNDFSLAYTVVNKQVIVSYTNDKNEKIKERTEFSWVSIYKKYSEGWKLDCIASTNSPSKIIGNNQ